MKRLGKSRKSPWPQWMTTIVLAGLLWSPATWAQGGAAAPPPARHDDRRGAVVALPRCSTRGTGHPGETLTVEAVGLTGATDMRIRFEPQGLSVSNLRSVDRGSAFQLAIAVDAGPGAYSLVVQGRDQQPKVFPGAFTVLPASSRAALTRILRVEPDHLEPGGTYNLTLLGTGFSNGMSVDLGHDVQIIAPAMVQDQGRATLQVQVSPSALPGVRLASVRMIDRPAVKGPGGVQVILATGGQGGLAQKPPTIPKVEVTPPSGKIFLRAPNITGSGEFVSQHMGDDPPLVQQGTQFTWFEQNPGVAEYYVLTIKDKTGKVLAKVQTPASKNYYRVTKPVLLSLPTYTPDAAFHYPGPAASYEDAMALANTYSPPGAPGTYQQSQLPLNTGLPKGEKAAPPSQMQMQAALDKVKAMGDMTAIVDPDLHLIKPTDHADATWNVTGYWKHPLTHEDLPVETSENYPLKLPRQPKGMLTCDVADQPSALKVLCVDPSDPNTSRACLVGNTVILSGSILLDRDPYPVSASLHTFQDMAAQYTNVYLSWGDGTVSPLVVDMTPSGQAAVKIQYQGKGLSHVYDTEGPFLIQIYSLPNPESSNPSLTAMATSQGPYAQAYQDLVQGGPPGSAQKNGLKMNPGAVQKGSGAPGGFDTASPGSAMLSGAAASAVVLANDAFLVACVPVNPVYSEDMVATGPLHLLKVEITGFPGHSEKPPQVPQVKDCSQGFTAQAALTYYGQGEVAWSWIVDGVEIPGGTRPIGPGKKTPPAAPEILVSGPLPVALTSEAHKLSIKAWVVIDIDTELGGGLAFQYGQQAQFSTGGGTNLSQVTSLPGTAGGSKNTGQGTGGYTVLRPSLQAFASLGTVVTSSSVPAQGGLGAGSFGVASSPMVLQTGRTQSTGLTVGSPLVNYQVVAHDPNIPCSLLFQTAKGPFIVTDLGDDFAQQADGTFGGSGSLILTLPDGQSGTEKILLPVTFKGWTLEGSGDGREVVQGSLDATPNHDVEVVGLTGEITKISGTAGKGTGEVQVTFHLGPSSFSTLVAASGSLFFEAKGPITPEGDFTAPGLQLKPADIGYSGYRISASEAVLDLSRNGGDAPTETACNATGSGQQWVGLLLKKGTLKTGNISLVPVPLPDVTYSLWSIGPGGLSGRLANYSLNASMSLGLATVKVSSFDFFVCGSNLASTFTLAVSDYPFINGTLSGKTTIDEHGVSQNTIQMPPVDKDFGTIHYKSSSGSFGFEQGVGWRLVLNGTFGFRASGKPFCDGLALNGLQVLPTGKLRLDGGATLQHLPMGGSGTLGQVTVDMIKADAVTVGFGEKTALILNLTAGFHLSPTLSVTPSVIHYKLIPVAGQDGHFSAVDPKVDNLHIENHYPYNSDVNMDATISYKDMGSGNTRFSGKAKIQLMSGFVDAEFLLGYQSGQDYWLTRVGYNLGATPAGILPPFLMLYEVHGALGHNINFDQAVAGLPIDQIQPVFNGSYLFRAGCQVGDGFSGGWVYYFDGTFTVDTTQGARIDAKGWLLTTSHSGSAPLNGTIQYASGQFSASLQANLTYLAGAYTINGTVSILIGNNWHIWLGTDTQPVTAHALVVDCTGYLMLDDNGLRAGGSLDKNFHGDVTLWGFGAYLDFHYWGTFSLAITKDVTYGIHLAGTFSTGMSGSAGIHIPAIGNVGFGLGGGLDLSASAMPVSVCGSVWVDFGCYCFCPCSWKHPFTFKCCCDCYKTSVGVCLP